MTLKQAKNELRAIGCTLAKRDGEYRVRVTATGATYFTDCIHDAVSTGRAMVNGTSLALSMPSNQFAALSAESPEHRLASVPAWEGSAL